MSTSTSSSRKPTRTRTASKARNIPEPAPSADNLSPEEETTTSVLEAGNYAYAQLKGTERAKERIAREQGLIGEWDSEDISDLIDGIVRGAIKEPEPDLLEVSPGGNFLLYRSRVNGIHGHSNSGKSWTALLACKQQMEAGNAVFYIDHEDDSVGILTRLLKVLKVDAKVLKRCFHYFNPRTRFDQESVGRKLDKHKPSLVVIDAMGGSLSMHDLDSVSDPDILKWTELVSAFIAERGPAVLILDHLPKDTPPGTLWPLGSQRKKAAITGAQYLQQMKVPFSRKASGYSELVCAKDRGGHYTEGEVVAHMKFDSVAKQVNGETIYTTRISLADPPPKELADAVKFKKTATAVCGALAEGPLNRTDLKNAIKGDNSNLGTVVAQLEAAGFIRRYPDGRSTMHELIKPYDGSWTPEEAALAGVEV